MGARGPAPTPTPILAARGSWRATARERDGEPRPPVERPACPDVLDGEARAEWDRQVEQLAEMGVLAKVDRAALAAWCIVWGQFIECCRVIREGTDGKGKDAGLTAIGSTGSLVQSPYVRMRDAAIAKILQLAAQFGFTPAARSRIRAIEHGAEPAADELEDFLRRGREAKAATRGA